MVGTLVMRWHLMGRHMSVYVAASDGRGEKLQPRVEPTSRPSFSTQDEVMDKSWLSGGRGLSTETR